MNNEYYLYGLQRSGTNYLRKLIELNFSFLTRNKKGPRSWKHRLDIPPNADNYTNIVLYKNPYKWIDSLVRNSEDFFERQTQFECLNSDGTMNMLNIAKTYRHHSETWVLSNRFPTIKYEKLLSDKYDTLMFIAAALDTDMVNDDIIEPKSVLNSRKFTDDKKKYYIDENATNMNQEQIDEVNQIFDVDFLSKLGYSQL